jgi:hypothetical protein
MDQDDDSQDAAAPEDNVALYREAFIAKCHHLVLMGYSQMNAPAFKAAEETVVSGELVKEIKSILESEGAPDWADRFDVHDDPPQNAPGRLGKRRRRADIGFIFVQRGVRPRFLFEAKRLYNSGCLGAYLGANGLGMYISGEYAPGDFDAGMLGYVQVRTIDRWTDKIRHAIAKDRKKYQVASDGDFRPQTVVAGLSTHRSSHNRKKSLPIAIYHSFLGFQ